MKFIWEQEDIVCGRIVGLNLKDYSCDYAPNVTYKIGYFAGGNQKYYCLVALTDGMIGKLYTREELVNHLNKEQNIPLKHKDIMKIMESLHDIY